ncbi:MAG TPA: 4'-phosphopantetheinyl transferase superfamily protein [Burkholderiaceae bacterium]|nr:4'-phosphopantetheinyl transferase superfamily protein [Burkholderiaceae bacterium]
MACIELWRVRIGLLSPAMALHWGVLDASEQQRASQFRNEADRERFVVARATLRNLLGRHLRVRSERVAFENNAFGKPFLAGQATGPAALHFNTSHSGDWVLHAFSLQAAVGVDVEAISLEPVAIADYEGVLAPEELQRLRALPQAQQAGEFTAIWVAKEAYAKALGRGVSTNFAGMCVSPCVAGRQQLLYDRNESDSHQHGTLLPVDMGRGYAACLACLGAMPEVRIFDYLQTGSSMQHEAV